MAIINNLNGDKVEFTGVSRVWNNTKYDFEEIYFGDKQIFSIWSELESPLPITILTAGEDLIDYRIYGNTENGESVGERTENLFDINAITPNTLIDGITGKVNNYLYYDTTAAMEIENDFTITFVKSISSKQQGIRVGFYDAQNNFISYYNQGDASSPLKVIIPTGTKKVRVSYSNGVYPGSSYPKDLFIGLTAPTEYIPYGYQLPMVVRSKNLFDKDDTPLYPLGYYLNAQGVATKSTSSPDWYITEYIKVKELTNYYLIDITDGTSYGSHTCFYDSNKNFIGSLETLRKRNIKVTTPQGCTYMCASRKAQLQTMIILGDEIPDDYIPYYRDEKNIYIGSDPLAEDEYVDFGAQKVHKRTSNLFDIRKVASNIVTITGDNEFQKAETEEDWYDLFDHQTSNSPTRKADTTKCLYLEAGTYTLSGTAKLPDDDYADLGYVLTAQSNGIILAASTLPYTFTLAADNYITIRIGTTHRVNMSQIMITAGSETPSTYESYFTPTDPPVPIPALPTIQGETIIDYNPSETPAVEPEKMYTKYRKEGF